MNYRTLGRTGLQVSELGFGCGAVGGLLVRGDHDEMVRVVAHAIDQGINYFDTARSYGNGQSESSLGRVLEELQADVLIGTKVQLTAEEMDDIERAVIASVEGSLKRLRRDYIELIQLHNFMSVERQPERGWVSVEDVEPAIRAFETLKAQGKVGFYGINGLGETDAVHSVIEQGQADTVQICYNLLNPSAGIAVPSSFPFQDYAGTIDHAAAQRMGVIAIRVLAAGALSGIGERHVNAAQNVDPIASSDNFADDLVRAQAFHFLVEDGTASSPVEAAIRFVLSKPEVSTTMVGISSMEQLEAALAATEKGPLPADVLNHLAEIWSSF
ncbi:MAG: aldo/keto reductase [Caldilineaceae bacterium]|nr:aldo/keto reductase [Caldilineaceae bacterium]